MSSTATPPVLRSPTLDTLQITHQISLSDYERPSEVVKGAEHCDSEGSTASAPSTPGSGRLSKKLTSNSIALHQNIRRELNKRKYAKFNRQQFDHGEDAEPRAPEGSSGSPTQAAARSQAEDAGSQNSPGFVERGVVKVNKLMRRKRTLGMGQEKRDIVVDILYENQRGLFLFGIPKYSSSSLLPKFDPKPWQNAQFRASPVNIRNAQLPDPSWEWAWKTWYVDMGRDVDQDGWEYSFEFSRTFAWHGNHPWFHSFVRRRRWLRMRRRRDTTQHHTRENAHELTSDYFTIHPKTLRATSEDLGKAETISIARMEAQLENEEDIETIDIKDVGSLDLALRKATVDREKLVAVRKFLDVGGDEIYYLRGRIPAIMAILVFQSSRRQLLTELLRKFDETRQRMEESDTQHHTNEVSQTDRDAAARHAENLMGAVKAADEQVKLLEYWSDVKAMSLAGHTLQGTSEGAWNAARWQGLDPTAENGEHPVIPFRNKQHQSEPANDLNPCPEHPESEKSKGKQPRKADESHSEAPSKSSSIYYEAPSGSTKARSVDTDVYTTPAETPTALSSKRNSKRSRRSARTGATELDGIDEQGNVSEASSISGEGEQAETDQATNIAASVPSATSSTAGRRQSVTFVEPVAALEEDRSPEKHDYGFEKTLGGSEPSS